MAVLAVCLLVAGALQATACKSTIVPGVPEDAEVEIHDDDAEEITPPTPEAGGEVPRDAARPPTVDAAPPVDAAPGD